MIFEDNREIEVKEDEEQVISSITVEYYLSTSKDTPSEGIWQIEEPQQETGKYVWVRTKVTYKNPTDTFYSVPIRVDMKK